LESSQIRAMTSEQLYVTLSAIEDDLMPELEQVLLETSWTDESVGDKEAGRIVELLRQQLVHDS